VLGERGDDVALRYDAEKTAGAIGDDGRTDPAFGQKLRGVSYGIGRADGYDFAALLGG
jgi:hypothetical protein